MSAAADESEVESSGEGSDDDESTSSQEDDSSADESSGGSEDEDEDGDNQTPANDPVKAKAVADDVAAIKRLANDMQKIYLRLKFREEAITKAKSEEVEPPAPPKSPQPQVEEVPETTLPPKPSPRPPPIEIPKTLSPQKAKTDVATDSDDLPLAPSPLPPPSTAKLPFEDALSKSIETKLMPPLAKGQIDSECKLHMELKATTALHLLQYMRETTPSPLDSPESVPDFNDDMPQAPRDSPTHPSPKAKPPTSQKSSAKTKPKGPHDSIAQPRPEKDSRPPDHQTKRPKTQRLTVPVAPLPSEWSHVDGGDEASASIDPSGEVGEVVMAADHDEDMEEPSNGNHEDEELVFEHDVGDESTLPVDELPSVVALQTPLKSPTPGTTTAATGTTTAAPGTTMAALGTITAIPATTTAAAGTTTTAPGTTTATPGPTTAVSGTAPPRQLAVAGVVTSADSTPEVSTEDGAKVPGIAPKMVMPDQAPVKQPIVPSVASPPTKAESMRPIPDAPSIESTSAGKPPIQSPPQIPQDTSAQQAIAVRKDIVAPSSDQPPVPARSTRHMTLPGRTPSRQTIATPVLQPSDAPALAPRTESQPTTVIPASSSPSFPDPAPAMAQPSPPPLSKGISQLAASLARHDSTSTSQATFTTPSQSDVRAVSASSPLPALPSSPLFASASFASAPPATSTNVAATTTPFQKDPGAASSTSPLPVLPSSPLFASKSSSLGAANPLFSPLTSPIFSSPTSPFASPPHPTQQRSSVNMAPQNSLFDKDLRVKSPPMSPPHMPTSPPHVPMTRSSLFPGFGSAVSPAMPLSTIEYEVNAMHYLLFGPPP